MALKFTGVANFRQRLIFATLAGRPVQISEIRALSTRPGLRDYEAGFLRLVDKLTNGCQVEINETGTRLRYKPGMVTGGSVEHDCGPDRAIGYYIEGLLPLVLFAKRPVTLTLRGITNHEKWDPSVDTLRTVTLRLLKLFGVPDAGLELRVKRRGAPPGGGGLVVFRCPAVRALKPVQLLDAGLVQKIRGIVFTTKVSPQIANRVVTKARSVLNQYCHDVYLYTDAYKGAEGGASPGFGVTLVAESTTGCLHSVECAAPAPRKKKKGGGGGGDRKQAWAGVSSSSSSSSSGAGAGAGAGGAGPPGGTGGGLFACMPEDLGQRAAEMLCDELAHGGCVDAQHQGLVLTLMVLCPEDVSKVRVGATLTDHAVRTLRALKAFFGVQFKLEVDLPPGLGEDENPKAGERTILCSCLGVGYSNLNRAAT